MRTMIVVVLSVLAATSLAMGQDPVYMQFHSCSDSTVTGLPATIDAGEWIVLEIPPGYEATELTLHVANYIGYADVYSAATFGAWTRLLQHAAMFPGRPVYISDTTRYLRIDVTAASVELDSIQLVDPVVIDPAVLIAELVDKVVGLNLQQGIENSLDAKLDSALNALDDVNQNNDVAAVNSLQAFINGVEAQRGNKLTDEQADILVADAQAIIDLLTS
jgi:hypothetical protein